MTVRRPQTIVIDEWVQLPGPLASRCCAALQELGASHIAAVMSPVLPRRRRPVLREAGRFPDLARKYHQTRATPHDRCSEHRTAQLAGRGELVIEDPLVAATQFAFLVVGEPLDTAMFCGVGHRRTRRELHALADAGAWVFLAAYGRNNETMRLRGGPNSNS